jgi:hydroxyacylglutathione hydrolase
MATVRNIAQGVSSFTSNAFLVDGERTVLVDAGDDFDAPEQIETAVGSLDRIVLTHTHPDHIGNVGPIVEAFDVEVWGFDAGHDLVDHGIDDGDDIEIGDHDYEALHTPGHKDDHICLFSGDSGNLFAGDLVFANGGFGRTDIPEGDRATLIDSIEYLLSSVEGSVSTMYVGHGPTVDVNPERHIELALEAARF